MNGPALVQKLWNSACLFQSAQTSTATARGSGGASPFDGQRVRRYSLCSPVSPYATIAMGNEQ